MANFTPEDVVRRYKETGIRPGTSSANIRACDGKWEVDDPRFGCCAMGVMLVGEPVTEEYDGTGSECARQLGVDFWGFSFGFDNGKPNPALCDDYQLGLACRQAVEKEFGPVPYYSLPDDPA